MFPGRKQLDLLSNRNFWEIPTRAKHTEVSATEGVIRITRVQEKMELMGRIAARTAVIFFLCSLCAGQDAVGTLLAKTREYEARLVDHLTQLDQEHGRVRARLETFRELYREGLVARIRLEAQEEELRLVDLELQLERKRLGQSRELRLEILAGRSDPTEETEFPIERFRGGGSWELEDLPALSIYYQNRFGEALPISAQGQTEVHTQLGFDHRGRADLAIHPDSEAGKVVLLYLRQQEIPYIAFRAPIEGAATGAHIHVGPPSNRFSEQ